MNWAYASSEIRDKVFGYYLFLSIVAIGWLILELIDFLQFFYRCINLAKEPGVYTCVHISTVAAWGWPL